MFDIDPPIEIVLETLATKVKSDNLIKVKPTTKPAPTRVSNTYACLTNDNDDDDVVAGRIAATNRVTRTEKSVKGMNNKKMISQGMKEYADDEDDDDDDDTDKSPVLVEVRELRNTEIMEKNSSTTEVLDLGIMITINNCMPGVNNSVGDALVVTVATKNSCEGK